MKLVTGAISKGVAHKALQLQKNSPALLFGAGIVGTVTSTVLACRATLKLDEVLSKAQDDLEVAKSLIHENYSEGDRQRDISIIYVRTSVEIARLYAPSIIVGGASIAALTRSHNILTQRNAALTAAYAALEKGFAEYRERVVEKYGEEEDQRLRYGSRKVSITDEETKRKKDVDRVPAGMPSIYARFFEMGNPNWNGEPEYNFIFLRCQQNYANDLLHARGHVFLNDVYDMIGLERTSAGAVVGWVLNGPGSDNFIGFGCFDADGHVIDFMLGEQGEILLDFNVDGVVWDLIDTHKKELSRGD